MNKNQKIWIGIIAILVLVAASWGLIAKSSAKYPPIPAHGIH